MMHKPLFCRMSAVALLVLGMVYGPALALDEIKIEGTAFVDDDACAKSENCDLTFKFGGRMAKTIYEGMGTVARENEDTGGFDKTDRSGMSCHMENERYSCSFRYDFKLQAFSLALIEE
jgi:cytoskeletal protein CcmA (bactofilin family)